MISLSGLQLLELSSRSLSYPHLDGLLIQIVLYGDFHPLLYRDSTGSWHCFARSIPEIAHLVLL